MNNEPNKSADSSQADAERVERIFDGALQLPLAERREYVKRACGTDDLLRGRVEVLLQSNEEAAGFMTEPAGPTAQPTMVVSAPLTEKAGDKIGAYKLLQAIGEGGCGVVYMAEQEEPVRRRVALKVIKLGMDTKQVIARFEAERQALAIMEHSNIAKVLDAGTTDNGRPFFVMELVRGIKITDYCDQNKLSTRDRLALFVQVCNAIQHAHQKGIIHRDIKPSNILVTLHDGVPMPKVIDFGIAKATQGRLTDQTLFTAFEQFIGTPAYMSPEQAELSGLDVDTRTDIYALGVLLYELLTGHTPFDAAELAQAGLDALRRTIREKEPERPSARLRTLLAADLTAVAQRRQAEVPRLINLVRGDLDWISMKALEKDRTRRYETANALAVDVQHYLSNEPVAARPPSTPYRFQKLVRRNKLAFAAGAAVLVVLLLGLGTSTVLLLRERAARKRADEAERVQRALTRQAEADREIEALQARIGRQIGLGALYMTQGRPAEAEREIAAVPLSTLTNGYFLATGSIFNYLGEKHARHEHWPAAITNFSKLVAIVPDDFSGYRAMAALLAQTGDLPRYRQFSEAILRHFAAASTPTNAAEVAETCLLLPPAPEALEAIGRLADTAVTAGSNQQYWARIQVAKSLAELRRGRGPEALTWAKAVLATSGAQPWVYAKSRAVAALAQHQLDRKGDARSSLDDAVDYLRRNMPKAESDEVSGSGLGDHWRDWVMASALLAEARSAIRGPQP